MQKRDRRGAVWRLYLRAPRRARALVPHIAVAAFLFCHCSLFGRWLVSGTCSLLPAAQPPARLLARPPISRPPLAARSLQGWPALYTAGPFGAHSRPPCVIRSLALCFTAGSARPRARSCSSARRRVRSLALCGRHQGSGPLARCPVFMLGRSFVCPLATESPSTPARSRPLLSVCCRSLFALSAPYGVTPRSLTAPERAGPRQRLARSPALHI